MPQPNTKAKQILSNSLLGYNEHDKTLRSVLARYIRIAESAAMIAS